MLGGMIGEGLSEEVTFELRLDRQGVSHKMLWVRVFQAEGAAGAQPQMKLSREGGRT